MLRSSRHAGAVILRVTYGITAPEETDYYSELAHIAADSYLASANHGSFLIDHAPWLKYVPGFFHSSILMQLLLNFHSMVPWSLFQIKGQIMGSFDI